jgi:hypothetical protein
MSKQRADLGFSAELEDFDPQAWTPPPSRRANDLPQKEHIQEAAKASGFRSREAGEKPQVPRVRRRRTGRNTQFNIKTTPETIEAFCRVADANGWGLGETLEHAVMLLELEYETPGHAPEK